MKLKKLPSSVLLALVTSVSLMCAVVASQAADKKPNIVFIMGDDVGWFNVGAYHQGIMSGKTPNLDKLAAQGVASPTTTPRQVARRGGRTSSPVNCPFAPD
jgi:Sulfatase